jgi:hypothetical protein
MSVFAGMATQRRWIAWRNEPRADVKGNLKVTKVPYSPMGGKAQADDPGTWGTRLQAEACAAKIVNGQGGGIGIELGPLGDDFLLAGVDLDTCRSADGGMTPWADRIIERFGTYTEVSPSGQGVKLFFRVGVASFGAIETALGDAKTGKQFKQPGGGDHPPGIEIYFRGRYFAVTEQRIAGTPEELTIVPTATLLWLLDEAGPALTGKSQGTGKSGGDDSRSAAAFRIGIRMRGASCEEFCEAVRADPETADWYAEKGIAVGGRELKRIWGKTGGASAGAALGPGPTIEVISGKRHLVADRGLQALRAAGVGLYQRDQSIVRMALVPAKDSSGKEFEVPGIVRVTEAMLGRALGRAASWQRYDSRTGKMVAIDPPTAVVRQILDMSGEWPFPPLTGIIQSPTLRRDGSLLEPEGYDGATGLMLVSSVELPPIGETRMDAEVALDLLNELLLEFPFVEEKDRAVALSMILTSATRAAFEVAPMHLIVAPRAGTGKSYLADVASMIATGDRCAVKAASPQPEETEKRLVGAALAGYPIIALDNCRDLLEGDFLCQITERPLLSLRALGKSDPHRISNTYTFFANGNNCRVADDMVRRTIRCALDANCERPETRAFKSDPLGVIAAARG